MSESIEVTEEWARSAPAGRELDRVCAKWMGLTVALWVSEFHNGDSYNIYTDGNGLSMLAGSGHSASEQLPPRFSTCWSAAGPLLEAMMVLGVYLEHCDRIVLGGPYYATSDVHRFQVSADNPCLAIARACATLEAQKVKREVCE